jgi:hypothetical protein
VRNVLIVAVSYQTMSNNDAINTLFNTTLQHSFFDWLNFTCVPANCVLENVLLALLNSIYQDIFTPLKDFSSLCPYL